MSRTRKVAIEVNIPDFVNYKTMEMLFENKIKVPKSLLQEIQKLSTVEKDMYKLFIVDDVFNDINGPAISNMINKQYNAYKKVSKYVSDTYEKPDITFWDLTGKVSFDCSLETFKKFLVEKEGASAWTWNHQVKEFQWCDKDAYNTECKRFRKLYKQGELTILEANNKTRMLGDVEWHCLVVQTPDGLPICPASANLFRFMVCGYVYWFNKKSNRDTVYKFLTK
jgi:hypothetical protein